MNTLQKTLYIIQTHELAVDHARSRVKEIEQALAFDERVAACEATLGDCEEAIQQTSAQAKDLELEITGLKQKIAEVDKLLYSGQLGTPKEMQERQDELESLRRREVTLEAHLQETTSLLETHGSEREQATRDLETAVEQRDQSYVELIAERDRLQAEITLNLKQRKAKVKNVPDPILKQYRVLRKRKNGQAVALIDDRACSVCRIEQPSSEIYRLSHEDELIHCVGCGRILVSQ